MNGETNLDKLIRGMNPKLNKGKFVFCKLDSEEKLQNVKPKCLFRETEGITVILPKTEAEKLNLPYAFVCSWITLSIHSSLDAIGLTAKVSRVLAEAGISCNIVAAYYHDHLFVPIDKTDEALKILQSLKK
jgi:uncharacterized protein